jgi:hypothetical protein
MDFRISGLRVEPFIPFFARNDAELLALGARHVVARPEDAPLMQPCRVGLRDSTWAGRRSCCTSRTMSRRPRRIAQAGLSSCAKASSAATMSHSCTRTMRGADAIRAGLIAFRANRASLSGKSASAEQPDTFS